MRYRKASLLALALALTLAAGLAAFAQDTSTSTGRINNVDTAAGTITVTTAGGGSDTFSTDAQSMYMSNGRTVNLRTLKVGDQVTITYRTSGNTRTATHVDVVATDTGTTTNPSAIPPPTRNGTDATGKTYDSDNYRSNTNEPGATTAATTTGSTYDRNSAMNRTDENLPRTGSTLPLIGLAGALCGGAALTLAGLRRFSS